MPNQLPVPNRLAQAFEGRTSLTLQEAAAALEMDRKTLRREVDLGRIKYILRGMSQKRQLRRFLLSDLLDYLDESRQVSDRGVRLPVRASIRALGPAVRDFQIFREQVTASVTSRPGKGSKGPR